MFGKINQYSQIDILGQGMLGIVWLVQSLQKDKYALKLVPVNESNKQTVKSQAEMYVQFNHPNLIKGQDFFYFNQDKFLAIILEYCPDGDLSQQIKKMDEKQAKNVMKQIVDGLVYLHDQKIIHRDLKPQNILMKDGVAKLCDLGISKSIRDSGFTTKVGTPFYMAPEALFEQRYGSQVDIWALGIIFLELSLNKTIDEITPGKLTPAKRQQFPSESLLNQVKDKTIRELIRKMLDRDPTSRPTAKKVQQTLKQVQVEAQKPKKQIEQIKVHKTSARCLPVFQQKAVRAVDNNNDQMQRLSRIRSVQGLGSMKPVQSPANHQPIQFFNNLKSEEGPGNVRPIQFSRNDKPMQTLNRARSVHAFEKPLQPSVNHLKPMQYLGNVKSTQTSVNDKPIQNLNRVRSVQAFDKVTSVQSPGSNKPMQPLHNIKPVQAFGNARPVQPPGNQKTMQALTRVRSVQPLDKVKSLQSDGNYKPTQPLGNDKPVKQTQNHKPAQFLGFDHFFQQIGGKNTFEQQPLNSARSVQAFNNLKPGPPLVGNIDKTVSIAGIDKTVQILGNEKPIQSLVNIEKASRDLGNDRTVKGLGSYRSARDLGNIKSLQELANNKPAKELVNVKSARSIAPNVSSIIKVVAIDERKTIEKISEEELIDLCKKDVIFPNLWEINLWSKIITDEGLEAFASAAVAGKLMNLHVIYLGSNKITDKGVQALSAAITKIPNLQVIDLSDNKITDKGAQALATAISKLANPQVLNLSDNKITDKGLEAFAAVACKLPSLQIINLFGNQLTEVGVDKLATCGKYGRLKWLEKDSCNKVIKIYNILWSEIMKAMMGSKGLY